MEELLATFMKLLNQIDWEGLLAMMQEGFAKIQESRIFDKIIAAITELLTDVTVI